MQALTKKYGLFTAIAMVVGIVIGSGVFFKAQDILEKTEGDLTVSILAWIFGGLIMLFCVLAFSMMATRYEKVSGIVDYAEATVGKDYGYFVGWFNAAVYLPSMTGVLAWVSARFTVVFLNSVIENFAQDPVLGSECMVITLFYMVGSYALNALAPKLAGRFQVTATVIKLIPLVLMGVVGVIVGLGSGTLRENFAAVQQVGGGDRAGHFFAALVSTAFAYEGWIIATGINAEIKNAKRNLPIALTFGSLTIIAICVLYNIGIAGSVSIEALRDSGAALAFTHLFGDGFGAILNLFVVISCLGTLNGLMLGSTRTMYALAVRGQGPRPEVFSRVDETTDMPQSSAISGLLFSMLWFFYFYAANLANWCGPYGFDSSELPIVTVYIFYMPMFVQFMRKNKDLGVVKRFVLPILAVLGSLFMIVAAVIAHGKGVVYYLIVFAAVMAIGVYIEYRRRKTHKKSSS